MLQNATPLRKSAPWPPNISDEHVFCTAPATENASLQILFKCPTPAILFGNATKPSRFSHFWQGAQSLAPATRNDIWTSKSGPNPSVSNMLTSKRASRHNSVPFFDISTSKSGLDLVCFVHVDFEMCFAPKRCALFRHLNFQKWSGPGVVCTFWIRHVLRATTACTFSTSQLPKVVRTWCALYMLTSKCASRHNGMHFFDILNVQKWSETLVFLTCWLRNVLRATMACTFSTSQVPKVVRTWCALCILTSKCASRHNSVRFFDVSTSKSGPDLVCFVHVDFEMCFAPLGRALFRHLDVQKWSRPGLLCAFWLRNVLPATTACNFFISHLPSRLRTHRFSEPTFRPSGASNHWKNTVFRDFPTFSGTWIFFLLRLSLFDLPSSSLLFSSLTLTSAFHLSILSEVWLLNFLRWWYACVLYHDMDCECYCH